MEVVIQGCKVSHVPVTVDQDVVWLDPFQRLDTRTHGLSAQAVLRVHAYPHSDARRIKLNNKANEMENASGCLCFTSIVLARILISSIRLWSMMETFKVRYMVRCSNLTNKFFPFSIF
jgi:hypothetical protein